MLPDRFSIKRPTTKTRERPASPLPNVPLRAHRAPLIQQAGQLYLAEATAPMTAPAKRALDRWNAIARPEISAGATLACESELSLPTRLRTRRAIQARSSINARKRRKCLRREAHLHEGLLKRARALDQTITYSRAREHAGRNRLQETMTRVCQPIRAAVRRRFCTETERKIHRARR
jgi:hypothetical protein